MSDAVPDPPPSGDDDTSVVLGLLTRTGAKGLSVTISVVHRTIELVCLAAAATGLVALVLGVWAWHESLPGSVIAVVGGGTTLAVAVFVLTRIRALAQAVKHPSETLSQAQDLVLRAKGSPELHRLAGQVRARKAAKAAGLGRFRRALGTGRLISRVIGLASPDPERHRYLVPFAPDRLRNLWLAILVGLWAWLVSAVIASLALLSLAIQSL
ncbi:hypothetical protein ACE2AJ_08355 [Aquihabitans daechungensis]|uniref:hypothetical protein n=1 Tax=Aquihabitans daechungensis TaxID=1052257 RepID=UPI003BA109B2